MEESRAVTQAAGVGDLPDIIPTSLNREARLMKTYPTNRRILIGASMALFAGASSIPGEGAETKQKTKSIDVQFLEIVTLDVKETVALYSKFHGVSFSEPNSVLGGETGLQS